MKKILIAVDGSAPSVEALEFGSTRHPRQSPRRSSST